MYVALRTSLQSFKFSQDLNCAEQIKTAREKFFLSCYKINYANRMYSNQVHWNTKMFVICAVYQGSCSWDRTGLVILSRDGLVFTRVPSWRQVCTVMVKGKLTVPWNSSLDTQFSKSLKIKIRVWSQDFQLTFDQYCKLCTSISVSALIYCDLSLSNLLYFLSHTAGML